MSNMQEFMELYRKAIHVATPDQLQAMKRLTDLAGHPYDEQEAVLREIMGWIRVQSDGRTPGSAAASFEVLLDALETAVREGPKTTLELMKVVDAYEGGNSYGRTYSRLRRLERDGRICRQKAWGRTQVLWLYTGPDDDLETLWNLPEAKR